MRPVSKLAMALRPSLTLPASPAKDCQRARPRLPDRAAPIQSLSSRAQWASGTSGTTVRGDGCNLACNTATCTAPPGLALEAGQGRTNLWSLPRSVITSPKGSTAAFARLTSRASLLELIGQLLEDCGQFARKIPAIFTSV